MRTHLVAAVLMSLTPISAMAVVADEFICRIKYHRADGSVEFETDTYINGKRLPESRGPETPTNASFTSSDHIEIATTLPGDIRAVLRLDYRHALERGVAAGTTPRAAEHVCVAGHAQFPATVDYDASSGSSDGCRPYASNDPFNPNDPTWEATEVVNGVPKFKNYIYKATAREPDYTKGGRYVEFECLARGTTL